MTGIPSAGDARRVAVRVLLRAALLTGMVVGAWLLGSATGLAQEDWAPRDRTPHHQATLDHTPHSVGLAGLADAPIPAVTPADVSVEAVLPAVSALPLPVQPVVQALEPVLPEPVLDSVISVVAPEPAAVELPGSLTAADLAEPLPPADPAEVTVGPRTPPPAPTPHSSEAATPAAPTLAYTAAAEPAGERADADHPVSPVPERPPGTMTTSCPATSVGSNTTTKSAYAVTLDDGSPEVNLAPLHRRMHLRADGPPGSLNQRPSTSPD